MKLELSHLNKSALSALLFVCIYQVFHLLLNGSFVICLFFLCAALVTGRTLINEQISSKKAFVSRYQYALYSAWLALYLLLFTADDPSETLGVWFCILILCTSILLNPSHSLRLNIIALVIYWVFAFLISEKPLNLIESALGLTVSFCLMSLIQRFIFDLEAKLNTAKETDKLTGCIQPSVFKNELEKVVQLHERYSTPFSLVCIKYQSHFSIESHFQTWLIELVNLYQSRLRKTDVLCRFDTQKFMILLPSTNTTNAEALILDLKSCANAYEFSYQHEAIQSPTLSFTTEIFLKGENIEDWFKKIQSQ